MTSWPTPVTAIQDASSPQPLVEELAELLAGLLSIVDDRLARASSERGLGIGHGRLLMMLEREGVLTSGELGAGEAHAIHSRDLRSLRDRGLVAATRLGDIDGFRLSARGRNFADALLGAMRAALSDLIEDLDRSHRLRIAGALHLLGDQLDEEHMLKQARSRPASAQRRTRQ